MIASEVRALWCFFSSIIYDTSNACSTHTQFCSCCLLLRVVSMSSSLHPLQNLGEASSPLKRFIDAQHTPIFCKHAQWSPDHIISHPKDHAQSTVRITSMNISHTSDHAQWTAWIKSMSIFCTSDHALPTVQIISTDGIQIMPVNMSCTSDHPPQQVFGACVCCCRAPHESICKRRTIPDLCTSVQDVFYYMEEPSDVFCPLPLKSLWLGISDEHIVV